MIRLGSFCTGYGGLDLAVAEVLDVEHAWHAEIDPDASKVLTAYWPGVPNHGDLRATDWSSVESVDVLTAGFPCQPVSAAGRRKGITDERWLFDDIADAVGRMVTRPRMLVLENVPGLLTANRRDAMARVVQGLAALGYVGRYRVVRAADVGAAHRRERIFIVAHLANTEGIGRSERGVVGARGWHGPGCEPVGSNTGSGAVSLLPTPNAAQGRSTGTPSRETARRRMYDEGRRFLDDAVALLPTPRVAATRTGRSAILGSASSPSIDQALELARGELPRELCSLDEAPASWRPMPPPRASDGDKGGPNQRGSSGDVMLPAAVQPERWGAYAVAVARWERVIGRSAPDPTELGTKGQPRLSPLFVEWLMGLPAGWVTDHLGRNPSLRVLGNGVVPQQAAAALRSLGVSS